MTRAPAPTKWDTPFSKRPGANERGYSYRWQRARLRYLRTSPLCQMCLERGFTTAAVLVDHRVPHGGDMRLFWDRTNWQSLCAFCHDAIKGQIERHGTARGHAADGSRLYPLVIKPKKK